MNLAEIFKYNFQGLIDKLNVFILILVWLMYLQCVLKTRLLLIYVYLVYYNKKNSTMLKGQHAYYYKFRGLVAFLVIE